MGFGCNQDRSFLRDIHMKNHCHDPYTGDPLGMDCLHKNQPDSVVSVSFSASASMCVSGGWKPESKRDRQTNTDRENEFYKKNKIVN